uniref:NADH-ubiquinone oxidoreductase chain 3 n=1 Tax=Linuche unguiculata TaxID=880233 RepID=G9ISJ4_LINUG|nr:NADH dehydrogenase subunit 3 [Linuche unguiculata]
MYIDYYSTLSLAVIGSIISGIISIAAFLFSSKSPDKEKLASYECGFDPFSSSGQPFSIKFFLVAILFLIFDVEVALLFPWSVLPVVNYWVVLLFLIILTLGLVYEWLQGGLEWE